MPSRCGVPRTALRCRMVIPYAIVLALITPFYIFVWKERQPVIREIAASSLNYHRLEPIVDGAIHNGSTSSGNNSTSRTIQDFTVNNKSGVALEPSSQRIPGCSRRTYSVSQMRDVQQSRNEYVEKQCAARAGTPPIGALQGFMVADRAHHWAYCSTFKVAFSSWTTMLIYLKTNSTAVPKGRIPYGHVKHIGYQTSGGAASAFMHKLPGNYFKFMFVRHPLSRLVSGYVDKFIDDTKREPKNKIGIEIVKRFRKNASKKSLQTGQDVTFPEFVKYIIHLYSIKDNMDPHWRPMTSMCEPCKVKYDFIGKMESIAADAWWTLSNMQQTGCPPDFIKANTSSNKSSNTTADYIAQLPEDDLKMLYKVYEDDFEIFGYTHSVS